MNYSFACASDLYTQGVHPRILCAGLERESLLATLAHGDGALLLNAFRNRVRPMVELVQKHKDDAELMPKLAHKAAASEFAALLQTSTTHGLLDMAMLAFLDADSDAAAVTVRLLKLLPALHEQSLGGQIRSSVGYSMSFSCAMAYDLVYQSFKPGERRRFDRWALRIVRDILAELTPVYPVGAGQNIPLYKLQNAVMLLLALENNPGMPGLQKEWETALAYFEAGLNGCFCEDGYPSEDTGYGTYMAGRMSLLAEVLRRAGKYDVYRNCPRYARFGQAVLHLVQPWGEFLATTGDHGDDFGMREFILPRLAAETNDPALLWLLGTLSYPTRLGPGAEPAEVALRPGIQVPHKAYSLLFAEQYQQALHPAQTQTQTPTAFRDRGRGIVSFRDGWHEDATFVLFDGSQRPVNAKGHEHASAGHFALSALGEYFSIGTGRYNMEQNCHSVVLINGKSGRDSQGQWRFMDHAGILTGYAPGDFVDMASVDSTAQHNSPWGKRHLALVKGDGIPGYVWIVDDINACYDKFAYWWQMQVCPENRIRTFKDHATVRGWRHGNLLDVHFAQTLDKSSEALEQLQEITQDIATPSSYNYVGDVQKMYENANFRRPADQVHYSAVIRPRLLAKFKGFGYLMSLMLPRRQDTSAPEVTSLPTYRGTIAVRVRFAELEDIIIFANNTGLLRAADIDASGAWCVVRRRRADKQVVRFAAGECSRLIVAGKTLI